MQYRRAAGDESKFVSEGPHGSVLSQELALVLDKARDKVRAPHFMMPESLSSTDGSFHSAIAKFKHEGLITLDESLATHPTILNSFQFIASSSCYESRFGSLD